MTLAAIDPIILIAAAAYGVFAWFNDRRQKKALAEEEARNRAEGTTTPSQTPLRPASTLESSEEERMRKFLEALGVPSGPAPLRPAPQPAPPKPAPPVAQRPMPKKQGCLPP